MACVFDMSMMRFESAATLPSPRGDEGHTAMRILRATTYPLSTGLIIAIIAFLIWSLFRFLLSLADFIYVVTDVHGEHRVERYDGWWRSSTLLEAGTFGQIVVVRRC